jgi:hypothetical protein
VGEWRASAGAVRFEEPVEFLAGGIEGTLLLFLGFHGVDQRSPFFVNAILENLLGTFF